MSDARHTNPGDPDAWLVYARADLAFAEIAPPAGVFLELMGFHAQQAAEKALKAALLARTGETPPRTHDLPLLLDLLRAAGAEGALPLTAKGAQTLTQYAVITRYPADLGEMDKAEWRQAVADARAVVEWAEAEIAAGA